MQVAFYIITLLATSSSVLLPNCSLGLAVLHRLHPSVPHAWCLRVSLGTVVGLVIMSWMVMTTLAFHVFTTWILIAYLCFGIAAAKTWWPSAVQEIKAILPRIRRSYLHNFLVCLAIFTVTVPVLLTAAYPAIKWDSTESHLPLARYYATQNTLEYIPFIRYAFMPQSAEMLFASVYKLYPSPQVVQTFVWLTSVVLALTLIGAGEEFFDSPWLGAFAASLFLGSAEVFGVATVVYQDMWLTLTATNGLCLAALYWRQRLRCWALFAGLIFGAAAATKYTGLLLAAVGSLLIVMAEKGRRPRWASLLSYLLAASIVAVPWYARDFMITGNPVFPFFPRVIPSSRVWNTFQVQSQLRDLSAGTHGGVSSLALLLHNFILDSPGPGDDSTEWAPFNRLLIPLAVLSLATVEFWSNSLFKFAFVVGATEIIGIGIGSPMLRYALPGVVPFTFLAALPLEIARRLFLLRTTSSPDAITARNTFVSGLVCCALALPSAHIAASRLTQFGPIPTTRTAVDAFCERHLPTYPAYQYLNDRYGSNYTVYGLLDENMNYYAHGRFRGDWFGSVGYDEILGETSSWAITEANTPHVYAALKKIGAQFLVIGPRVQTSPPMHNPFFAQHFVLVYAKGKAQVFEVR